MENMPNNAVDNAVNAARKVHEGPVKSLVAGRTDHLPIHVWAGSYVIPADIVSALGEGNTEHGYRVLQILGNEASASLNDAPQPAGAVPIDIAGGEYVFNPQAVFAFGGGDMDHGHNVLDAFVRQVRAKTINTLKNLPGPKVD